METYITGTGQRIISHNANACASSTCVIHSPSTHCMSTFPTHWREDRRIMERICPHGVGHPDPDDLSSFKEHGCDGCCEVKP